MVRKKCEQYPGSMPRMRKLYLDFVESDIKLKADIIVVCCALTAIVDNIDLKQP